MTIFELSDIDQNWNFKQVKKLLDSLESRNVGYFFVDINTLSVICTNQALGFTFLESECLEHYSLLFNAISKEDAYILDQIFKSLIDNTSEEGTYDCRIMYEESVPLWIRYYLRRVVDAGKPPFIIGKILDITSEINNRLIIDSCLDGTYVYDVRNDICILSGKLFDTLELKAGYYTNAQEISKRLIHPEDQDYNDHCMRMIMENHMNNTQIEYRVVDKKGVPIWVSSRSKVFFDENGKAAVLIGGYVNIDKFTNYQRHVESAFETSDVTGLPNRYKMYKDMNALATKQFSRGFVIFIDVDNFLGLNTSLGITAGNCFLKEFANMLSSNCPNTAQLYHYEADKFIFILPHCLMSEAQSLLEKLKCISNMPLTNSNYSYTISTVAVPYRGDAILPEEILRKGSITMKKIKKDGTKSIIFKPKNYEEYSEQLELSKCLRDSVLDGMKGFFLVYQPFISAVNNRCIGVEALLRWADSDCPPLSPTIFIPILENLDLMTAVGDWVLATAAQQCKDWIQLGFDDDFYISVNATAKQLEEETFAKNTINCLKRINLPTKNIVIELTESGMMQNFQRGMTQLNMLREKNIQLAIDDFGTGYSSLSYLKQLPADKIKIDRSFIQDIENDDYSREFVSSIIKITKSINKTICLEGVETYSQMRMLRDMQSDVFQGFLFSKPLLPIELVKFVSTHGRMH